MQGHRFIDFSFMQWVLDIFHRLTVVPIGCPLNCIYLTFHAFLIIATQLINVHNAQLQKLMIEMKKWMP